MLRFQPLLMISLVLLSTSFLACSDPVNTYKDDASSSSASKYHYGESSKVAYNCITATVDANGTKWSYHVPEIMNLMDVISISVIKSEKQTSNQSVRPQKMPVVFLNKVNRDEFSNQNLTVRLQNVSDGRKSISVMHRELGNLTASAENGWCKSSYTQTGPNEFMESPHWKSEGDPYAGLS